MYEISESESDCVDLVKESSEEEPDSPSVHFRGDTVFCNQCILPRSLTFSIAAIHRVDEKRYFNFHKIFSTSYSLEHDKDISHIFLSSFVGTCFRRPLPQFPATF